MVAAVVAAAVIKGVGVTAAKTTSANGPSMIPAQAAGVTPGRIPRSAGNYVAGIVPGSGNGGTVCAGPVRDGRDPPAVRREPGRGGNLARVAVRCEAKSFRRAGDRSRVGA